MVIRLATSLMTLRYEINQLAPHRSKLSDGWIGDVAHKNRASRHNPNQYNVVTALDITHDPANGCDIHKIADELIKHPHPELAYIISKGRIAGRSTQWTWHKYLGVNLHTVHAHFAVGTGSDSKPLPPYDSTRSWGIFPNEKDFLNMVTETELRRLVTDIVAFLVTDIVSKELAKKAKVQFGYFAVPSSNSNITFYISNDHQSAITLKRGGPLHKLIKNRHIEAGLKADPIILDDEVFDELMEARVINDY